MGAITLSELVDLDRYPIDRPDAPDYQAVVVPSSCSGEFSKHILVQNKSGFAPTL